ncbi:TetR family transcriptional regulator [Haloactinospora alba]|uniref:TetR family transcriptional regulator n=1 Tax=Haloactinospora alba TaxID=405555 RepID=A0A543NJ00_9ACTN|nr:TetR/AcrR family transcriptional regulator [Haloactinospora alba]TQN31819.1 TetR family transcriptional regulator [Haloactinospora alba]
MSRNNAGLSTERIITEALRIIDGQGLRRLTMRRLGDALNVEAMAVYHHFPLGKEQLFEAIVAYITDVTPSAASSEEEADTDQGESPAADPYRGMSAEVPWDERLRNWARAYRQALLRHSGALTLLINRRPDTPAATRSLELHYAAFHEAGLRGAAVVQASAVLDSYVTGAVIHEVREAGLAGAAPAVVDGRFPHVHRLDNVALDPDQRFEEGLEATLSALARDA